MPLLTKTYLSTLTLLSSRRGAAGQLVTATRRTTLSALVVTEPVTTQPQVRSLRSADLPRSGDGQAPLHPGQAPACGQIMTLSVHEAWDRNVMNAMGGGFLWR